MCVYVAKFVRMHSRSTALTDHRVYELLSVHTLRGTHDGGAIHATEGGGGGGGGVGSAAHEILCI